MGSKDKFSVRADVFDAFTEETLFKLAAQGQFSDVVHDISQGKEAHVFRAYRKNKEPVIVKIYRLENANFNKMFSYIKSDPRYQHLKGNKRKLIMHWVQREFRNLMLAKEAGVSVPNPYAFKDNVLIMQQIGEDEYVYPQLKNADVEDPEKVLEEIIAQMRLLYQKAGLVHADLSMFNILCEDDHVVFIDMSQATTVEDPNAKEYLRRDIGNVAFWAKRFGMILDVEDVFEQVIKKENY